MADTAKLPCLLYVGDVAVEATVAGSALLFRLLQNYPPARLRIVEGNLKSSCADKRLPNVKYDTLSVGSKRLLHTRLHGLYSSFLHTTARVRVKRVERLLGSFKPEAVLTVVHGYSWRTAALFAEEHGIPLHLIVHDDWVSLQRTVLPSVISRDIDRRFGDAYRRANSRLCVSPYMADVFRVRYGAEGSVVYPSRAATLREFDRPAGSDKRDSLVFAYAGTVPTRGHADSLSALSGVIKSSGGKLIVYSDLSPEAAKGCGLVGTHVSVRPVVPFSELIERLRDEADVLFVPMSFAPEDLPNMRASFPSKLADYTVTGLPLLIWGPPSCSAVRWAKENLGVAEVLDEPGTEGLARAVARLTREPKYRSELGAAAISKGREFFSHEAAVRKFYRSIL